MRGKSQMSWYLLTLPTHLLHSPPCPLCFKLISASGHLLLFFPGLLLLNPFLILCKRLFKWSLLGEVSADHLIRVFSPSPFHPCLAPAFFLQSTYHYLKLYDLFMCLFAHSLSLPVKQKVCEGRDFISFVHSCIPTS